MTIGIINAMHKEHVQLSALLSNKIEKIAGQFSFTEGVFNGQKVVLMESGIGKVNATIGACELLHHYTLDMLINTGVAGGIDEQLNVMDVVVGKEVAYHDVDCGPEAEPGQVQGLPRFFEANTRLLHAAKNIKTNVTLHSGLICSGDQFITNKKQLKEIKERFPNGLAVDMESGALAQVCYIYKVPFLSFRIISDTPGADNHTDQYHNFWDTMADKSFGVTEALLKALTL